MGTADMIYQLHRSSWMFQGIQAVSSALQTLLRKKVHFSIFFSGTLILLLSYSLVS
jgi:hypothetical protein